MATVIEVYEEFNPGVNGDWRKLRKTILPNLPHTPTQIRVDGYVLDVHEVIYDIDTNTTILYSESTPRNTTDSDETRLNFVNDLLSKGWEDITDWKLDELRKAAMNETNNIAASFGASEIRFV